MTKKNDAWETREKKTDWIDVKEREFNRRIGRLGRRLLLGAFIREFKKCFCSECPSRPCDKATTFVHAVSHSCKPLLSRYDSQIARSIVAMNNMGLTIINATGDSMLPAIASGDTTITKRGGDYKIGDIIQFIWDGSLVEHRLIEIEGEVLTTKGDNNENSEKIHEDSVVGVVVEVIKKGTELHDTINLLLKKHKEF